MGKILKITAAIILSCLTEVPASAKWELIYEDENVVYLVNDSPYRSRDGYITNWYRTEFKTGKERTDAGCAVACELVQYSNDFNETRITYIRNLDGEGNVVAREDCKDSDWMPVIPGSLGNS